jgi:CheY-like chemotaxis protein
MNRKVILVAEDTPAHAEAIKRVLEEAGVSNPLHFVADGKEAIAYLDGTGRYSDRTRYPLPTLFLLDLVMPHKSGLEVLEWMRSHSDPQYKAIGKVVMTGMGNIEEVRRAYQHGAHSFLIKPLRTEDFVNLFQGLNGLRLNCDETGQHLDFEVPK